MPVRSAASEAEASAAASAGAAVALLGPSRELWLLPRICTTELESEPAGVKGTRGDEPLSEEAGAPIIRLPRPEGLRRSAIPAPS